MSADYSDADAVLNSLADKIDILPEEIQAISKRLHALSTSTVPPVWGYAGVLLSLVDDKQISDVFGIYATVEKWRDRPAIGNHHFHVWNTKRLAKQ